MSENKDYVVVKNGERQTGLLTQEEANRKADEMRQRLTEQGGQQNEASTVAVKQNLFG